VTAEILQFPDTENTGTVSVDAVRARAWSAHYAAEREAGAEPHLAFSRTQTFMDRHADNLIENIRSIMERG
jgi:hypothetical protein